jgi:hypothetical protein
MLLVFQQNSRPQASRMQFAGTWSAARETGADELTRYDALAGIRSPADALEMDEREMAARQAAESKYRTLHTPQLRGPHPELTRSAALTIICPIPTLAASRRKTIFKTRKGEDRPSFSGGS